MATRESQFMAYAAGKAASCPKPITRKEMFLAKAGGMNVSTPKPITRKEMLLDSLKGGGGSGGASGMAIEAASAEEMDTILANATENDIGKIYKYVGESTDKYESNAYYQIEADE